MNTEIINEISENLNIKKEGIEAVLKLLEDGNTVPYKVYVYLQLQQV